MQSEENLKAKFLLLADNTDFTVSLIFPIPKS